MSLSRLFLSLTLLAYAMIGFGWLVWSMKVVFVLALITGILLIIEGLGVYSYSTPQIRKAPPTE